MRTPTAIAWAALLVLGPALAAQAATVTVTVLDKDGKPVPDAVVVAVTAGAGAPARPLPATATIRQEKMQFVPAVSVVPVGARVTFSNMDAWDHHVRGSAAGMAQFSATGGFELRLDGKAEGKPAHMAEVTLKQPGPILLGCHIHGSMRGHVYVSESPWAARTTPEGMAVFDDMPEGPVKVHVWHADQLVDLPVVALTAGAQPARATVQLQVVPRRRRL